MARITRRNFAKLAASIGASAAFGAPIGKQSRIQWHERPAAYPEGIASADPDSNSVLLWTRHPFTADHDEALTVEISEARGAGYRRRSSVLYLTLLVPKAPTPSRSRFGKTQARARLFQDGKPSVKDIVVHAWIHRAREAVGDMQKLVAEADGVPLARLYADATAQVDEKIQSCRAGHVNGDWLA
jgi:hypothetical protein